LSQTATVFNLAQSGYGTDQEYLVFKTMAKSLDPEVVILLFSKNDFDDTAHSVRYQGQEKPLFVLKGNQLKLTNVPVPYNKALWETKARMTRVLGIQEGNDADEQSPRRPPNLKRNRAEAFLEKSHARNWLAFRLDRLQESMRAKDAPEGSAATQEPSRSSLRTELRERSPLVYGLLQAIGRQAQRRGTHFLVALVPDKSQVLGLTEHTLWQGALLNGCRQLEIECLDLLPAFTGRSDAYWRIDPHWNAKGHRLAAETILQRLQERAWIRSD
jgi:hypothetical protein